MASQRTSFDKLQRDRAKKAKAAAKREKRLEGVEGEGPEIDLAQGFVRIVEIVPAEALNLEVSDAL